MFSGRNIQRVESGSEAEDNNEDDDDDEDEEEEEELEVVDFNDVGKLFEQTKKRKKSSSTKKSNVEEVVEKQQFIGALSIPPSPQTKKIDENDLSAAEKSQKDDDDDASQFYIDTQPTPIPAEMAVPSTVSPSDDDVIVYVAPHPRKGMQTSPERQQPSTKGAPDTSEFTPYVRDALFSLAVASSSSSLTATKATIEQEPTQSQPEPEPEPEPQSLQPQISPSSPPLSFPTPKGKKTPGGRLGVLRSLTISPLAIRSRKRKKGVLRKKDGKRTANTSRRSFRAFGAMREEALLDHDPKWKERRRGDSDLDWGDTDGDDDDDDGDDGGSGGDHIADNTESPSGLGNGNVIGKNDKGKGKAREEADDDDDDGGGHGMEVDSDLDLHAMQEFVGGLLGGDAGRHVTMDDLKDEEDGEERQDTGEEEDSHRGIGSDESVISEGEDEEVEKVFADEEAMLISETLEFEDGDEEEDDEDDDDGSEDEEDEDQTPRTSFQRRLERLRKQASSSKRDIEHDISDDDDEDDEDDDDDMQMHFAEMNNFGYNKV